MRRLKNYLLEEKRGYTHILIVYSYSRRNVFFVFCFFQKNNISKNISRWRNVFIHWFTHLYLIKYPRKSQSRNYICQNKCNHVVEPNKKKEVLCIHNSMQMSSYFHLAVSGMCLSTAVLLVLTWWWRLYFKNYWIWK